MPKTCFNHQHVQCELIIYKKIYQNRDAQSNRMFDGVAVTKFTCWIPYIFYLGKNSLRDYIVRQTVDKFHRDAKQQRTLSIHEITDGFKQKSVCGPAGTGSTGRQSSICSHVLIHRGETEEIIILSLICLWELQQKVNS